MLTCTDEVEILALDLVHHSVHLSKAHNACDNVAADHKRRYAVCESTVDHEISCVCDHCGVKSRNITH